MKSFLAFTFLLLLVSATPQKQVYIVYMGKKMHEDHNVVHQHVHNFLADALGSSLEEARSNMIHTYKRSFTGFSATLTEEQAAYIGSKDEVVSIFPSETYRLHTTHSWSFMESLASSQTRFQHQGLGQSQQTLNSNSTYDVIVGVLDSGIWPESESFSDNGIPAIPSRWRGTCQKGEQFSSKNCNRKLIGARYYTSGYEASAPALRKSFIKSARDSTGHGTHTASTAAGNIVEGVQFPGGIAAGTARGGSPNSRIAVYKVCWGEENLCYSEDVLAGFDDAVADGVDILSVSLGPAGRLSSYFEDLFSIGAYHATRKNILVVSSAGNDGPSPSTASGYAPWMLTVAASSTDRNLQSTVVLGNNTLLHGLGINPSGITEYFPIALGSSLPAAGVSPTNASFCLPNTLDASKSKGKIVICQIGLRLIGSSLEVKRAGGVGVIVLDDMNLDHAQPAVIPGIILSKKAGAVLTKYLKDARLPVAKILKTKTLLHDKPSPKVAAFSGRGPNALSPDIIKPDITAPGVAILAAWSPISVFQAGNRTVDYNFQSGTSMSCPHITGVAALIKALHPTWTPAMIKSSIMTTAITMDNNNDLIRNAYGSQAVATPFDLGSGHVNPVAAADPGLVYDTSVEEYIRFGCGLNASSEDIKELLEIRKCPKDTIPAFNLNYPSIGVSNLQGKLSITRTVTNVGPAVSSYKVKVSPLEGVRVRVSPSELRFTRSLEKKTFTVELRTQTALNKFVFGAIVWTDGKRVVRSPIAVKATS